MSSQHPKYKKEAILTALGRIQDAANAGVDLSYLAGIVDLEVIKTLDISALNDSPAPRISSDVNYSTLSLSADHLSTDDKEAILLEIYEGSPMVAQNETGFFIRLYSGKNVSKDTNLNHGNSDSIKDIIHWAIDQGYQLLDFDSNAPALPQFPIYENDTDNSIAPSDTHISLSPADYKNISTAVINENIDKIHQNLGDLSDDQFSALEDTLIKHLQEWHWDELSVNDIWHKLYEIRQYAPQKLEGLKLTVPDNYVKEVSYCESLNELNSEEQVNQYFEIVAVDKAGGALVREICHNTYTDDESIDLRVTTFSDAKDIFDRYLNYANKSTLQFPLDDDNDTDNSISP